MRILVLSQWFQPEPIFKGLPFAKALAALGHRVEVLTGFPNYPDGKVYPGYRVRLWKREQMDGISIHRVVLFPSHDRSAFRRTLNYLSFALASFVIGPWLVGRPDVIYVYNLVALGPTAFLLRVLYGAKIILDVQDLWPESVAASGLIRNTLVLGFLNSFCRWVYRRVDRLTVLSPGFRAALVGRGVPAGKIDVIYNWCDETGLSAQSESPDWRRELGMAGRFNVVFAGTMGTVQGLDTVLDCAHLCIEMAPKVLFVLVGSGVELPRLEARAREMGLQNVRFVPRQTMEQINAIYAAADALLVHLVENPLSRITIPSKTQAYLFMGKPIVMAMSGDAADLVERSGAGIVCKSGDPLSMAKTVSALASMTEESRRRMGQAGAAFYASTLSMKMGISEFNRLMDSLQA